jgi:hypothetical protein
MVKNNMALLGVRNVMQPGTDHHFRPARQEDAKRRHRHRFHCCRQAACGFGRKLLQHKHNFNGRLALVERIDDDDQRRQQCAGLAQALAWADNQTPPLVAGQAPRNVWVRAERVADMCAQLLVGACQLHSDGDDKRARRLQLAASRKKKLAPRHPSPLQARATMRAMTDLPVPAMPPSQEMR